MLKRTIAGVLMGGLLFLFLWLTSFSHFIFDALIMIVGGIGAWEMCGALSNGEGDKKYNVCLPVVTFSWIISYPLCFYFGYSGLLCTFIASLILGFIIFIFTSKMSINDFFATIFVVIYPITLLSILFILNKTYGMIPVILAIAIGTISDLFAYFIGALFGKKKIFPKISPKKTYAGCIAGLFGGAVGGIIVYLIFELAEFPTHVIFTFSDLLNGSTGLTILVYACVGFAIAFFSEIGDLAASRIKREVGIKDYGKILGSHGGILDRIDSILFTTVCIAVIMGVISLFV